MNNIFRYIDTYRLAGMNLLLGVEVGDTGVKVLEVGKKGNPLNRYKAGFSFKRSFVVEFGTHLTLESKAEMLKLALREGVESRKAVVGLSREVVKVVEATVPHSTGNIEDWVIEHLEELLKMPIPAHQVSFSYQIIESNEAGRKARIAFIRKEKLSETNRLLELAGLQAVGIKVMDTESGQSEIMSQFAKIDPNYTNCASIAVSGFFPELKTLDFLPKSARESFEIQIYKNLFQRTVIALGIVLIVLLCIPFLFSKYLEFREADFEDKLLSIGPVYAEVSSLEQQIQELEHQLSGTGRGAQRSDVARVLYDLAQFTEDGIWFTKLTATEESSGKLVVLIHGYAKGSEAISAFMRNLERNDVSKEVHLLRSEHTSGQPQTMEVKNIPRSYTSFEMKVVL